MNDLGLWQSDVFVYVVPGYVLLLSFVYARAPERFFATREKLGAGEVLASVVMALLIGLVIHQISTLALAAFQRAFGSPTFEGIAESFGHLELLCQKLSEKLAVPTFDAGDCYLYARAYVAKEAPNVAEANERLLRLANVCQNMMVAILGAAIVFAWAPKSRQIKTLHRIGIVSLAAVLVTIFGYGLVKYWTAAVFRTLRVALLML